MTTTHYHHPWQLPTGHVTVLADGDKREIEEEVEVCD